MSDVNFACLEELEVGQSYKTSNQVTEDVIEKFADVSGDINPVHLDSEYAKTTMFGEKIAHGMISGAYISAIFGTKFPGAGTIYLSQSFKFMAPVKVNDKVDNVVTISDIDERRKRVTLNCECKVGEQVVTKGEALVMVPRRGE